MSRFATGVIGFVLGLIVASASVTFAADLIHLTVNGQEIYFPASPPMNVNGRILVPARPLAEALGGKVAWDATTQTVLVTKAPEVTCPAPPDATATTDTTKPPELVFTPPATPVTEPYLVSPSKLVDTFNTKYPGKTVRHRDGILTFQGTSYPVPFVTKNSVPYIDISSLINAGILSPADFE